MMLCLWCEAMTASLARKCARPGIVGLVEMLSLTEIAIYHAIIDMIPCNFCGVSGKLMALLGMWIEFKFYLKFKSFHSRKCIWKRFCKMTANLARPHCDKLMPSCLLTILGANTCKPNNRAWRSGTKPNQTSMISVLFWSQYHRKFEPLISSEKPINLWFDQVSIEYQMKVPEVNEVIGHDEIHTNMAKHCSEYQNSLQWRHNGRYGVSNHQPHDCLLKRSFRRRSKKTSKLRVTGLWVGNSPVTGEFPAQMASNAEILSFDDVIM